MAAPPCSHGIMLHHQKPINTTQIALTAGFVGYVYKMISEEKKKHIESLSTEEMLYEINLGRNSRFQREKFAYLQSCYQKRIEQDELFRKLASTNLEDVKQNLRQFRYQNHEVPYVRQWIQEQESKQPQPDLRNANNMMKRQCNLCGLREDTTDLVDRKKTWCLVFNREVDNKQQDCEHWLPDGPNIRNQKVQISNELRKSIAASQKEQRTEKRDNIMGTSPLSAKVIWDEIERDFDISKRAFGKKINFVTDSFKRKIIFRDVGHAYVLANLGYSKPAVILAGGVIEELLRLYLVHKKIKPASNTFDSYIQTCEQNGLLKSGISRLSDSVRHFRNVVHLQKEKNSRITISKAAAKGAVTSIFTIANDF